ncbi:MAG: hypothetical protein H6810_09460 [Phycisphaeraceae bacterium]|nr:MAG: hypothetical protein H6810_09460 [Phycisphaeraceae bacterium]
MSRITRGLAAGGYRRGGALKGCLVALGILALLVGIGAFFVATHWRGWAASGMKTVAVQAINQSDLPAGEKPDMVAHVEDYADAFKAGDVNVEQFTKTMQALAEGSLIPVGMVQGIEEAYVKPSGLPDEEKAAATLALQRFARGLHESKIPVDAFEAMAAPIGETNEDGDFHLKAKGEVTDDMLREAIANAKSKADEAGIAQEPFVIDMSDELKKLLDANRTTPSGG